MRPTRNNRPRCLGQHGIAAVELALILPLITIMTFVIIDFGLLIQARLIVANVAREGGSLAARDVQSAGNLITMLQAGATPLNLSSDGRIYIWKIRAGTTKQNPDPFIDLTVSANAGSLSVPSSTGSTNFGLTAALHDRLVFNNANQTADISEVTVVEVYYKYTPITPISKFVPGLLADSGTGTIILSKAVF
jgi:Flp pilus assembly protein TadG